MSNHGRIVCSCGALIAQCRCIEGHRNVRVVERGCRACQSGASCKACSGHVAPGKTCYACGRKGPP